MGKAARRGFYTEIVLGSLLVEVLWRNANADDGGEVRSDNSSVVEHVHSVSSVTKERMSGGSLDSIEEL